MKLDVQKGNLNQGNSFWQKKATFLGNLLRAMCLPLAYLTVVSIFGMIVFIVHESTLIDNSSSTTKHVFDVANGLSTILIQLFPIIISMSIAIAFSKQYVLASVVSISCWLFFIAFQSLFIFKDQNGFGFFFYSGVNNAYVNQFFGSRYLNNLSPNILVGLVIGFLVAWTINKSNTSRIFSWVNFNRTALVFLPFIMVIFVVLHLIIVGGISKGISNLRNSAFADTASSSYVVGFLEYLLMPFGMDKNIIADFNSINFNSNQDIKFMLNNEVYNVVKVGNIQKSDSAIALKYSDVFGQNYLNINDKEMFFNLFIKHFAGQKMYLSPLNEAVAGSALTEITFNIHQLTKATTFWQNTENRFIIPELSNGFEFGKYTMGRMFESLVIIPFMGILMIIMADKNQRKFAFQITIASIVGAFFIGTERTILVIILFSSPIFYFIFFVLIGPAFQMLLSQIGVSIESTNSGLTEFIRVGVIADTKSVHTGVGILFGISLITGLIYCLFYYASLKKLRIYTPGRGNCVSSYIANEYSKNSFYVVFHKLQPTKEEEVSKTKEFLLDDIVMNPMETKTVDALDDENMIYKSNSTTQTIEASKILKNDNTEVVAVDFPQSNSISIKSFSNTDETEFGHLGIYSPADGQLVQIKKDMFKFELFKNSTNIYAPFDGIVKYISPNLDEIILKYKQINVVLEFSSSKEQNISKLVLNKFIVENKELKQGDVMFTFNKKQLEKLSLSIYVTLRVLNSNDDEVLITKHINNSKLNKNDLIYTIEQKKE